MKRELAAVYDELLRRQQAGEQSVFLSKESLLLLRKVAAAAAPVPSAFPEKKARIDKPKASSRPRERMQTPDVPSPPKVEIEGTAREDQWANLKKTVETDPWCQSQVKSGKKVVFGVGSVNADIFFCGEAPGAEEEVQGEPFVGPAGELLTKIIGAMGLSREDVYIGNIMNYRPPMPGPFGNRPPASAELAYCLPYLLAQVEIIQPKVIVSLGKTAVDGLLGPDPKRRMARMRGVWTEFEGIHLMPTYHPSYLLRNQQLNTKRQVWEDMLAVMEKLSLPISDKQRAYFLSK